MGFFKKTTEIEKLIDGCVKNNASCQAMLFEHFKSKMFAICLRYSNDYHSAEDVLQEGFVKVFSNMHKFRGDGAFEGWLRRIFVNTAIEQHRKNNKLYAIVELDGIEFDEVNTEVFDKISAETLTKMVQSLSPGYRIVFNMYAIEGFSHKEIADQLSISEGTSKSQLSRARTLLKEKIEALNAIEQKNYAKTFWK